MSGFPIEQISSKNDLLIKRSCINQCDSTTPGKVHFLSTFFFCFSSPQDSTVFSLNKMECLPNKMARKVWQTDAYYKVIISNFKKAC